MLFPADLSLFLIRALTEHPQQANLAMFVIIVINQHSALTHHFLAVHLKVLLKRCKRKLVQLG